MKKNKSRDERHFERELRLAIQMSKNEAANDNQKNKKNKKLKKEDLTQENKDTKNQDNISDKNTDNIPNDSDNGEINEEADIKTTINEIEKENPKLELQSSDQNYQHPQIYQNNENESNDLSINSIEENNPPIEPESNQNSDLKESEIITNDEDNSFPIPTVNIPSGKASDINKNKEALNNNLFVEFQIEAPVPKPNSPKLFINKKSSNPQLPLLANSYSSTTSSTDSEDENIKEPSNRKKFSVSTNLSFSKDYQSKPIITPTVEQQQQQQNNEDSYFSHGDDDNFDYNDVEVDEIDDNKSNDAGSNEKDNEKSYEFNNSLNSTNSQNIHENVNNQIPQSNLNYQPLEGNSSINPNQNLINNPNQMNTNTNQLLSQNYIDYIQKRFNTARINDSKLISAFLYLDEYEIKKKEREKSKDRKDQKIELIHDGIPFYSFDFSNGTPTNSFPTDPINPSSKMNMTMGINDDFGINGHDFSDYGLGNALGIQTEMENDFQINVSNDNNLDKDQSNLSSYSFEIAPYLKEHQQNQQQENEDQIIENNATTPSKDIQSHLSNDENEYEPNEDTRSAPANNKGRSRYYQQNDESDSDEDYDSELNENKNDFSNSNRSFFPGSTSLNKRNENKLYDYSKLKKPKSKQINVAAFETVPFRPMNSEDFYSLMMNSMTYDENLFSK